MRLVSSTMAKLAGVPANASMSRFHLRCSSALSTDTPSTFTPRFSHSGASCATAPNSVVQTGVKSRGWLKMIA